VLVRVQVLVQALVQALVLMLVLLLVLMQVLLLVLVLVLLGLQQHTCCHAAVYTPPDVKPSATSLHDLTSERSMAQTAAGFSGGCCSRASVNSRSVQRDRYACLYARHFFVMIDIMRMQRM
jgi:hypothetical protein